MELTFNCSWWSSIANYVKLFYCVNGQIFLICSF
ncbi:hypothetical protein SLEP1_g1964 [Rubroshorea leprosula]|uniref:Uncharacterized protein n=1 Tax=Rubroshorea leprosula TaxID=152421 RepID=A0AAV5HFM9_9ROSI|nr:hypothetical protein SLEP1_g1964 [Rubroshorea leprosula]